MDQGPRRSNSHLRVCFVLKVLYIVRLSSRTVMYYALLILCFKNYVLTLKSCWLFNNHELASVNVNFIRNFGACASLKYFSLSVNAFFFCRGKCDQNLMIFGKKQGKMASFNYTSFRLQRLYFFISKFMPKLCTCCNTKLIAQQPCRIPSFYIRVSGTAALKVVLDHFLPTSPTRGRISLKSGQILSVIFHFYRRFSFILSNQSHCPL